ncbi:hypothetical protein AAFF_G00280600 [Aldrovandia affinis]|uniref:Torsin-1A C-terminal domain-containing protein n=1 Tax=Aldrovandia affinis TaxID=143900 RepID=A0AAD7RA20_9TELE|nr:hypothetical protein AAFF_G00280600 [Aldrovandia affinis]
MFSSCDNKTFHSEGLELDLKSKVFGQHLATAVVLNAVTVFMRDQHPQKPLVLSFHGGGGTGKNHVAKIIAQNIFNDGESSKQVHWFIGDYHFTKEENLETHKAQLRRWIRGNVTKCPCSMFIFDEMDKMNPELIDSLRPILDHYGNIDGVTYRYALFLFLSNAGTRTINRVAYDLWSAGTIREDIQLSSGNLETELSKDVFNNNGLILCVSVGGFWHSRLINKNVVDFFIPFLPLEYRHVRLCVLAHMAAMGLPWSEDLADHVAREMQYFPREDRVFSVTGCKRVRARLDILSSHDELPLQGSGPPSHNAVR